MKRRLFIAIPIPSVPRAEITASLEESGMGQYNCARIVPEENLHITLKFLGDVEEKEIVFVEEALEGVVKNTKELVSTVVTLEKFAYVPHGKDPRMLWVVGNGNASGVLGRVRSEIDKSLGRKNVFIQKDNRRFQTHITVVRFKGPCGKELPQALQLNKVSFGVVEASLMEAHLSPSGVTYEDLYTVPVVGG